MRETYRNGRNFLEKKSAESVFDDLRVVVLSNVRRVRGNGTSDFIGPIFMDRMYEVAAHLGVGNSEETDPHLTFKTVCEEIFKKEGVDDVVVQVNLLDVVSYRGNDEPKTSGRAEVLFLHRILKYQRISLHQEKVILTRS